MDSFTFSKKEKLCSQKIIGELFSSGNSFLTYPLKLIWKKSSQFLIPFPAQAAFSVPKRNFKRSHDRNYLKRRMRESYRFCKNNLYESLCSQEDKIAVMIVYIGKEKLQYKEINSAMAKAINRLKERL
jgi:ribonuclease P protein component